MSRLGEQTLIQHLLDRESVETLAREGLSLDCVPTTDLHRVITFTLNYFHANGRIQVPSVEVMRAEFGDLLDEQEIDITYEPDDSIEWAIDDLQASWLHRVAMAFNKDFATSMAEVDRADRKTVINAAATELVNMAWKVESKDSAVDAREAMEDRLHAYQQRAEHKDMVFGIRFGMPQIDQYTRGIHDGELAILAAGPKTGKSFVLDMVALREWQAGRKAVLYTLENSVEMTLDRIACMANGIDSEAWLHGESTEHEVERVQKWIEEVQGGDTPLHIIQPVPGKRGVAHMVRQAQLLDADSLLIDQLTFIEPEDERAPRHLQIREITHQLKSMISTGRGRLPCLLAHQINREGVKAADKAGHLEMYHMAEGSEVERTADWVFGLYRSLAEREVLQAKFQTLASRRADTKHFQINWAINTGFVSVRHEINLEDD